MRVRVRDCVYWGWGPFWALVVQILIWWPIVELVVRIASSDSRVGSNPLFYVVLFSLPFIGIAVNFCLFRFFRADIAVGLFWLCSFLSAFLFILSRCLFVRWGCICLVLWCAGCIRVFC